MCVDVCSGVCSRAKTGATRVGQSKSRDETEKIPVATVTLLRGKATHWFVLVTWQDALYISSHEH